MDHFPGSVLDGLENGENPVEMDLGWRDPVMRRAAQIRGAAQIAMARIDADARWQKALSAGLRPKVREWQPGAQVFYWRAQKAPQPLRGRRARMMARWNGPALILGKQRNAPGIEEQGEETSKSYWVVHNGKLLLVASEHLRSATREEALADSIMGQTLTEVRELLRQDRHQLQFQDLRRQGGNPEANVEVEAPRVVNAEPLIDALNGPQAPRPEPEGGPAREPEAEISAPNTPTREEFLELPQRESGATDFREPLEPWEVPVDTGDDDGLHDTLVLQNKSFRPGHKGKELDARWFDESEWESFREADHEQWMAHLKSGAIRVVPKAEVAKIDPARILPVPARFVRVNKDKDGG
jgi:hypothetical protein